MKLFTLLLPLILGGCVRNPFNDAPVWPYEVLAAFLGVFLVLLLGPIFRTTGAMNVEEIEADPEPLRCGYCGLTRSGTESCPGCGAPR